MKCPCWDDPCETEGCSGTYQEWIENKCFEMSDEIIEGHGRGEYTNWATFITKSKTECKCKKQPVVAISMDGTVECIVCHGVRNNPKGRAKMFS